jgi:uncharacterized hydrophobic protein (TIGR00341 family)
MRVIRILLPENRQAEWVDQLTERNIDYVVISETSERDDDHSIVEFPIPAAAVESVLADIREAGLEDKYTIITGAESAITPNFEQLQDQYAGETDDSIDPAEIRSKALGMTPNRTTYYMMTILSVVVATAGLLLDSPAIVVGAMVIAPQVSAALTASIGTVFNDKQLIISGFRSLAFGLLVAIAGSVLFGLFLRATYVIPPTLNVETVTQINRRISPGFLAVAVGIGAGMAGAFGLATAFPLSIVGVMIAAALIPAAAAVGIGIAWSLPGVALGALILLVVNAVLVTLSAMVVLWYLGYRPSEWSELEEGKRLSYEGSGHLLIAVGLLLLLLIPTGGVIANEVHFDREVNQEIEGELGKEEYEELELVEVQTQFDAFRFDDNYRSVLVSMNRPADQDYPELADALASRISDRAGASITVDIEYLEKEQSDLAEYNENGTENPSSTNTSENTS